MPPHPSLTISLSGLEPMTRTFLIHQNGSAAHQRSASQCTFALLIIVSSRCIKLLFVISSRWVAHPFSRLAHTTTIMVVYIYQYCMRYSSFHFRRLLLLSPFLYPSVSYPDLPCKSQPSISLTPPEFDPNKKVKGSSPPT